MRNDIDLGQFRKILEAEQISIRQNLDQETNSLQTYQNANPDLLDDAFKSTDQEQRADWIAILKERSNEIDEAIQRIDAGKFGICADCGQVIEVARLKIKPYAKYCINCKEKAEQKLQQRNHKHT